MEKETTPPECTPETDGSADLELLRAISANPECAHVLAEIARGGNPAELISTLLPAAEPPAEPAPETPAPEPASPEPTAPPVAMFQSPATPAPEAPADSCPSFLTNLRPDFWQDDDFNF